ncbi:hypothetical protein [Acaryochloris marina]|uniref:Uncharacterized protein n=1 Tax=Acaryochloris marina (strain MBIC 11017) TaxID=329726 RepID=A8ZMP9_ACAM1|nr:hypothetical protein [Acaryochloris marina]ABW32460.1 hypothetical protein AM1_C0155 [Acaryochloris marina MBIC11017]
MFVALNELKDQLAITRIKSWETFFEQLASKRKELESIADTVYELSGVSPGAVEDLDSVIVPLYNEAKGQDIEAINWERRSWWDWAHNHLLEQVGKAA